MRVLVLGFLLLLASIPLATAEHRGWHDERDATLLVVVNATGADGTFPFASSGEGAFGDFRITTTNGTGNRTFRVESDEFLAIAARLPAGWVLDAARCERGSPANVTLVAGATTTCWFEVRKLTLLHVTLATQGGDANVSLAGSGGSLPAVFHVQTSGGAGSASFVLEPGVSPTIGLTVPEGWRLAAATCPSGPLAANETRTCAFTLVRHATIRIELTTVGGDVSTTLYHATGGAPTGMTIATTGGRAWLNLTGADPALRHTLTLSAPTGWHVSESPCVNATVAPNGTLWCRFRATLGESPRAESGHAEHDDERAHVGGGPGFWRTWSHHVDAATMDGWVRNASTASAWLMPAGYGENATGAAKLLADATRGCRGEFVDECDEMRLLADYLVLRLNLESGHILWNDTRQVAGSAARETGLSGERTLRQIVDAFEARAGATLDDDELRAWRALL